MNKNASRTFLTRRHALQAQGNRPVSDAAPGRPGSCGGSSRALSLWPLRRRRNIQISGFAGPEQGPGRPGAYQERCLPLARSVDRGRVRDGTQSVSFPQHASRASRPAGKGPRAYATPQRGGDPAALWTHGLKVRCSAPWEIEKGLPSDREPLFDTVQGGD